MLGRVLRSHDTIGLRLILAMIATALLAVGLYAAISVLDGDLGRPPLLQSGFVDELTLALRLFDRLTPDERLRLAETASNATYEFHWYRELPVPLRDTKRPRTQGKGVRWLRRRVWPTLPILLIDAREIPADSPILPDDPDARTALVMAAFGLSDGSWVVLAIDRPIWGLSSGMRILIGTLLGVFSVGIITLFCVRLLSRPINRFIAAAERFGVDPGAAPIAESGPAQIKKAAHAFNAMQARIQRFVEDRTQMIAAISHDLRTYLTRLQLSAELLAGEESGLRMLEDLRQMESIMEATLAFARDDAAREKRVPIDLPSLLHSLVDGATDAGAEAAYDGPAHCILPCAPVALRRALGNLIDNAVKYGGCAMVTLAEHGSALVVRISDRGPGIPESEAERVFAPFTRMEAAERSHAGSGLGLTIARGIVRAHGGDITLLNLASGGLQVVVSLPLGGSLATEPRHSLGDRPARAAVG